MVATADGYATEVGVEILRQGGNAVDAAVAVAFALAVTLPEAGNLGGGGFLLLRTRDGNATAIDYRETAPAKAVRDIYLNSTGEAIKGNGGSLVGWRAAGVPGTVAGMERAWRQYGSGRLHWSALIEPARRLASEGFILRASHTRSLAGSKNLLSTSPDGTRIFLNSGKLWKAGDRLRQPELAETLKRLQRNGPREFYEGETARRIVADMAKHNGLMTADDLKGYAVKERRPLVTTYRGNRVISMPPPSSGGIALFTMLRILENYEIGKMGWEAPQRWHLMVEAMRRAFADRAEYLGDPDFVSVPVASLVDWRYADALSATINIERASSSRDIKAGKVPFPPRPESPQTTHFTVVDGEGNAVANTYTLNGAYGCGVVAAGTGVLLNNEMDDFATVPGKPNMFGLIQGEKNAVAPGKRPLSSMTPTLVLNREGKLWFTAGSPGGPTIINTVLHTVVNIVDHNMSMGQALAASRIHHQWLPDEITWESTLPPAVKADLERRGHMFSARARNIGDAQGILVDPATGTRYGASDPRQDGLAKGV